MNRVKKWRHLIAVLLTAIGFFLIYQVTLALYILAPKEFTIWDILWALWHAGPYFKMIVMMNFIIKPCLIYFLVLFIIYCLTHQTPSR